MAKKDNSEQWEHLLSDYRSSSMTANEWCQSNQVKRSIFYYWMRKLKTKSSEDINTKWASIPLPNVQVVALPSSPITLKIGDFSLEIESGFEKVALKDILSVAIQLC